MMKLKKILECVCMSCGKLKMDMVCRPRTISLANDAQNNPRFARTQLIKDPKVRLKAVWELCKAKMVCEGGDDALPELGAEGEPKHNHGGCGAKQPSLKREGLKFIATLKQSAAEKDAVILIVMIRF